MPVLPDITADGTQTDGGEEWNGFESLDANSRELSDVSKTVGKASRKTRGSQQEQQSSKKPNRKEEARDGDIDDGTTKGNIFEALQEVANEETDGKLPPLQLRETCGTNDSSSSLGTSKFIFRNAVIFGSAEVYYPNTDTDRCDS